MMGNFAPTSSGGSYSWCHVFLRMTWITWFCDQNKIRQLFCCVGHEWFDASNSTNGFRTVSIFVQHFRILFPKWIVFVDQMIDSITVQMGLQQFLKGLFCGLKVFHCFELFDLKFFHCLKIFDRPKIIWFFATFFVCLTWNWIAKRKLSLFCSLFKIWCKFIFSVVFLKLLFPLYIRAMVFHLRVWNKKHFCRFQNNKKNLSLWLFCFFGQTWQDNLSYCCTFGSGNDMDFDIWCPIFKSVFFDFLHVMCVVNKIVPCFIFFLLVRSEKWSSTADFAMMLSKKNCKHFLQKHLLVLSKKNYVLILLQR